MYQSSKDSCPAFLKDLKHDHHNLPIIISMKKLVDKHCQISSILSESKKNDTLCKSEELEFVQNLDPSCVQLTIEKLKSESIINKINIVSTLRKYMNSILHLITKDTSKSSIKSQHEDQLITLIEISLQKNLASMEEIKNILLSNEDVNNISLNLLWRLSILNVISYEQFLDRVKDSNVPSRLIKELCSTIIHKNHEEHSKKMTRKLLLTLITISHEFPKDKFPVLQKCSNQMLSDLVPELLSLVDVTTVDNKQPEFLNLYKEILEEPLLGLESVEWFLTNQLIAILSHKPDIQVSLIIERQENWRSTKVNKRLSNLMQSIIIGIGVKQSLNVLDTVVSTLEVNWNYVLTFLATVLLAHQESVSLVKSIVSKYLRRGCSENEVEFLILGFLFARHACQEGRHVFPSYAQWFCSTFGSEVSSPATTKQTFLVLIRFLTDTVPFDSADVLRTHIHQSIFVPKGCQNEFKDYLHLARAQVLHLDKDKNAGVEQFETNPSSAKNQLNVDISTSIEYFEATGKISSSVIEATVFKRNYYLNSFVPLLLSPRILPKCKDAKMKFIEALVAHEKIPVKQHKHYLEQCRNFISVADKSVINLDIETPLSQLQSSFDELLNLVNRISSKKSGSENLLGLLSNISHQLEKSFPKTDRDTISYLLINEDNYNSETVINKAIRSFLTCVEQIVAAKIDSECEVSIGQILSVIGISNSLQSSLITTLLVDFKSLPSLEFDQSKLDFFGAILAELKATDAIFLSVKQNDQLLSWGELLFKQLPSITVQESIVSCFILSSMLHWGRRYHQGTLLTSPTCLYFCLASRLCLVQTESHYPTCTINDLGTAPPYVNNYILKCCSLLFHDSFELSQVSLEDWLKFELKTNWFETPLDLRLRHYHFWLQKFSSNFDSTQVTSSLFWALVTYKSPNGSDLLVVLQSFLLKDQVDFSILDAWKSWKTSTATNLSTTDHNSSLISFMSVSRCLCPTKFFNESRLLVSSQYLRELVDDLLNIEGSLFLNLVDTLFLFECFLIIAKDSELVPFHVQQCFVSIKKSVLYHWRSTKTKVDVGSWSKRSILNSMINLSASDPSSWKALSANETAIMLISNVQCEQFSNLVQTVVCVDNFPHILVALSSVYGFQLITKHWPLKLEPSSKKLKLSVDKESVVSTALRFILCDLNLTCPSPLKMMSMIKSMYKNSTWWKPLLVGLVEALLSSLIGNGGNSTTRMWLLSLLIVTFSYFVSLYEHNIDPIDSDLDYLCCLNHQILLLVNSTPADLLKLINNDVLTISDSEIKASIRMKLNL